MLEEFRQYVSDEELAKVGPLVQRFPKARFSRRSWSRPSAASAQSASYDLDHSAAPTLTAVGRRSAAQQ